VHTIRRPTVLLVALLGHRLLPARLVFRDAVRLYGAAICVLGAFGATAALAGQPRVAGVAAGLVYGAFAAYLALVRGVRGALPCGCWGPAGRADAAAVLRSLAFVLAAATVALSEPRASAAEALIVACMAVTTVALLVGLRGAFAADPAPPVRGLGGRHGGRLRSAGDD
jgi:hypothetical protein